MLVHLSIQNYALIRQLEIDFSSGFTVITGETGAGKSILLGALNLILGKRADSQVLFGKSKKCVVEGTFAIEQYNLADFYKANGLEYDHETILRREVSDTGKSRAFINDTPVNLSLLKELAEQLIDIHSQHQTVMLNDADFQLAVIDSYCGISENVKNFKSKYHNFIRLKTELDLLIEEEKRSKSEMDYFNFLFSELETSNLTADEQEKLEEEQKILNHSEDIKHKLNLSIQLLSGDEHDILGKLNEVRSNLNQLSGFNAVFKEITSRLESVIIELNDLYTEIEKSSEGIIYDPIRVNNIKERLDLIYHLQNKHRVNSIEELIAIKENLQVKLSNISALDEKIHHLTMEINESGNALKKDAIKISNERNKRFNIIEKEISKMLTDLGMPFAQFKIQHELSEFPGKDGMDTVKFLFNANRGGELMELSKVASGGELSRLMLAVKSLISQINLLPTVIFDEIDIGVSGQVADKVGSILSLLSEKMQVIAITHLPQIAGKGKSHYYVFKETGKDSTTTDLKILNAEERVLEIAKMLSGKEITPSSVETARHLLNSFN